MADHSPLSPIFLSNGQPLCGAHGFVTCAKCRVDYTFWIKHRSADYSYNSSELGSDGQSSVMSDVSGSFSSSDDTSISPMVIDMGSRQASESAPIPPTGILIAVDEDPKPKITALPKRFASPNSASPRRLFKTKVTYSDGHPGLQRFVGVKDSSQCLAYAAGACFENEKDNKPKAGWSFVFRPRAPFAPRGQRSGGISGHLETTGPTGATRTPTSQRAQLRAVIAALRYLNMHGNSFKSVVIATDSPYVVNNATRILPTWLSNGWRNHLGHSVSNRDLWQNLVEVVDSWAKKQKEVYLWRIPRRWNLEADELARLAAASRPVPVDFGELIGRW